MPPKRAIDVDQADIEAGGADADAGEKIHAIEQRPAPLHRQDSGIRPAPRREDQRQRHVRDCRYRNQHGEEDAGPLPGLGAPARQCGNRRRRDQINRHQHEIERQKLPQEPELRVGQERQTDICAQIGGNARVAAQTQIGRIDRDRIEHQHAEHIRNAEAAQPIADEAEAAACAAGSTRRIGRTTGTSAPSGRCPARRRTDRSRRSDGCRRSETSATCRAAC